MEDSQNQWLPPSSKRQFRDNDLDIIKGARQTDQLEQLQESTRQNPALKNLGAGASAAIKADKGDHCVPVTTTTRKPISPKGHALIDYALVGSLLVFPSLLGMNKKARRIYAAEALVLLPYIAFTRQPIAVKGLIPFAIHGKIDFFNLGHFALQSFFKPFRKTRKALIFNITFTALAGLTVLLTDWKQETEEKTQPET